MMTTKTRPLLPAAVLILTQLACNLAAAPAQDPAATLNALYTQSAQTLQVMATNVAQTSVAQSASSPTPTATRTSIPGFNTPTQIGPFKTATPTSRCNWLDFITDVTYPDGTSIGRSTPFTKVWRVKNIGTCTWTTAYDLVFVTGDSMAAPVEIPIPENVDPGETIDLKVNLVSPSHDGSFIGYYKLRDASGLLFGAGDQATTAIWVDIKVRGVTYAAYDFAFGACDAQWGNGSQVLPCPGAEGDNAGYVIRIDSPKLEDGKVDEREVAEHYGLAAGDPAPETEGYGELRPDDPARGAEEQELRSGMEPAAQQRARMREGDAPEDGPTGRF